MEKIFIVVMMILGLLIGTQVGTAVNILTKTEVVKACNRKGAIYSDGVCQHVFAPICRRL